MSCVYSLVPHPVSARPQSLPSRGTPHWSKSVRRPTRDVVLVEGTVETVQPGELTEQDAELFAARIGFDPRRLATPCLCFRAVPRRVQARREADELDGRELMRDGRWLKTD
jgi:hypothetical protein